MIRIKDYERIVGSKKISALRDSASNLDSKHIVHVNSTYYGGGVAEMLNSIVPLLNDLGIETGWRLLKGTPDFFYITKGFHNAIQGAPIHLSGIKKRIYEEVNEMNSTITHLGEHDCIIIHDPQPLPLITHYKKKQPWIWRCHIDLSRPNSDLWKYLSGFIRKYDSAIISNKIFDNRIPIDKSVIAPAIDPLSPKNMELKEFKINKMLKKFGIDRDKPIISQISRFDKWKDPIGVIRAFRMVRKNRPCRLVLLGSMATDDPEGQQTYDRIVEMTKDDEDIKVINHESDILVNALQRASSVVMQKSIKEGFGLTVSEALWKSTPVVAGNAGGIPLQVRHGKTGYLVDDVRSAARYTEKILSDSRLARKMGKAGHEWVKEKFLVTRQLRDYVILLRKMMLHYKI